MAEDKKWKQGLGFLESIMFDPVTSGILGLGEGIMNLFGVSEKNSQIDALKDDYEKMKFSEDAMSRREARVKQIFGNLNNSMIGASQYLNGDTMRAMQNTKLATESAKATLDQRLKDEQYNMSITDKINQLEGQKAGYVPAIMSMLSGGLQGVFGATQSSMAMDQKEEENDLIRRLYGDNPTEKNNLDFGGFKGSLKDMSEALAIAGKLPQSELTPYEYKIQAGKESVKNNNFGSIPNLEATSPNYFIQGEGDKTKMYDSKTEKELSYDEVFNNSETGITQNLSSITDFNFGGQKTSFLNLLPNFSFLRPQSKTKKQSLLGRRF